MIKKHECTTRNIANKGFSLQNNTARFNFCVT